MKRNNTGDKQARNAVKKDGEGRKSSIPLGHIVQKASLEEIMDNPTDELDKKDTGSSS
jgi:hypothetical protein